MPSLTTQSIGAAAGGAIPVNQGTAANIRSQEAAQAAGINLGQNQARARKSADSARDDADRSVQIQKRAEGSFSGHGEDGEKRETEQEEVRTPPTSSGRLNKTA